MQALLSAFSAGKILTVCADIATNDSIWFIGHFYPNGMNARLANNSLALGKAIYLWKPIFAPLKFQLTFKAKNPFFQPPFCLKQVITSPSIFRTFPKQPRLSPIIRCAILVGKGDEAMKIPPFADFKQRIDFEKLGYDLAAMATK
jgi:hypothetical protein